MPTKRTSLFKPTLVPKEELPEVFSNTQFTSPADRLIEAIRQHYSKVEGCSVDNVKLRQIINQIVEKRL